MLKKVAVLGTCVLTGYTGCMTNINAMEVQSKEIVRTTQENMNTYYRNQLNDTEKQVFDLIRDPKLWLNGKSFLVPLPDNLTDDMFQTGTSILKIKNALQYEAADIFWVNPQKYAMTVVEQDGEKYIEVLAYGYDTFYNASYDTYGTTYEAVAKKVQEDYDAFNAKVKSVAEEIRQKAIKQTPYYLASEINTWLCEHNVYSSDQALGTLDNRRSAFSALMSENDKDSGPVCNGYGYGFKVLADELGLTSVAIRGQVIIQGATVEHFWNRVLMPDGKWYDVDATWNDSPSNNVLQRKDFFLVGSETETQPDNPNIKPIYKENHPVVHAPAGNPPALATNRYTELDPVAMIQDRGYATLQEAIDAVQDNEVITLYENLALTQPLTVTGNKNFTLDFNGNEITSNNTIMQIENGSTVTLRDRTLSSSSDIYQLIGLRKIGSSWSYIIENQGSLIIESGRIFPLNYFVSGNPYTIGNDSQEIVNGSILFVKPKDTVVMPADIKLDPSSLSIKAGDSMKLTATITPENTTYKDVTWTSSDDKVVNVDKDGNILGVGEGTAVITAENFAGKRAFCVVTVSDGQLLNRWENELVISDWTYGETESNPFAKSLYGTVRYEYSDKENGTYSADKPTTAGTWYVKAIVDETSEYTGLQSNPVRFTISKKVVKNEDIIIPSNLSGVIGTKLSQITLPEGWSWINQEETLTSSKNQYTAVLTLKDTSNYDYTGVDGYQTNGTIIRDLGVQVSKKQNSFTTPLTMSDWTYGDNTVNPSASAAYGTVKYVYSELENGVYTEGKPKDAGTWYVKAIVDATDEYTGLESDPVSFTINRKVINETDIQNPSSLIGISRDKITSITLPKGWTWKDENTVLSTKVKEYPAILTLTKEDVKNHDYSNLNGYVKDSTTGVEMIVRNLSVQVDKKVINDITVPENLSGTVKDTLGNIALPTGWTWENSDEIISIGDNTYPAIFTLLDEDECDYTNVVGYEPGKIKKELIVTGNRIVVNDIELPETLTGIAGNTLSSVILPTGWSWQNPNEVLSTTIKNYTAVFTPSDEDLYDYSNVAGYQNGKIVRNLDVSVSANPNSWLEEVTISDWTYGDTPRTPLAKAEFGNDSIYYLYSDIIDGTYSSTVPTNAGTWYVKAMIDGTSEYEGLESLPKAFQIYRKVVTDIEEPTNLSGTAGSLLSTISLPQGWVWENPNEVLSTSKQTANATLTLNDENNIDYSNVEGYKSNGTIVRELTILISKNENQWIETPSIEDWTYGEIGTPKGMAAFGNVEFTYSSSIQGPFVSEQPTSAGNWYMKASVKGNEDYASLEMVVPFTIHKAQPTYEIPNNLSAYAGSKLSDIQLPEGFTWKEPSMILKKGIEKANAVYVPKDSLNYESVQVEIPIKVLLQENEWTILPDVQDTIFGNTFSTIGYSRSGEPYFLYSSTIDGTYTKDVPTTAGTWYAIAKVDGNDIYGVLESKPIAFVINPKTLQDVSFNENLQLFDGQTQLQEGVDYTYTIEDKIDFYQYTITLIGNYQGVIVKKVNKQIEENTSTQEQEKPEIEENKPVAKEDKEEKAETNKESVQTGYNQSMQLYGWLAFGSIFIAGLALLRKRKMK